MKALFRSIGITSLIALAFGLILAVRQPRAPAADQCANRPAANTPKPPPATVPATNPEAPANGPTAPLGNVPGQTPGNMPARIAAALEAIDLETDPMRREELLLSILNALAAENIPSALATLENSDRPEAAKDLGVRLVRRWAETAPEAAAALTARMAAGPLRTESLDQVAIAWANHETAGAADWARQLPDVSERNQALRIVAYETLRTQPMEALRLAAELPSDPNRDRLLRQAAMEWASLDPAEAAEWARQIPGGDLREEMLAGVAMSWSENDPVAAATMTADELAPGRLQSDTAVSIAERWVQQKPEDAAIWVQQFPEGDLKRTAVESVTAIWSLADAPRAKQWKSSFTTSTPVE